MMSLNEALARNRLFWATYIKEYPNKSFNHNHDQFIGRKLDLFFKMFPHVRHDLPHCFACHYNLEHVGNHCGKRCIIPWTGFGMCTDPLSPYRNDDAQGVLDCIDKAIKRYDKKIEDKRNRKELRILIKDLKEILGGKL